jgi:hypothetical protein
VNLNLGECGVCKEPVLWARTSTNGRVALDPDPRPDGFVVLDQFGCTGPLDARGVPDLSVRYVPHRLTCRKWKAGS